MSQISTDSWTIQRLLQWTTEYFKKRERESPRLAAEVLLAEALACRRIDLYARFTEVPPEPLLARFRDWVKQHAAGNPVAYLVGHRDFYSLRMTVDSNVLIPRPETELLVVEALDALKQFGESTPLVIDVGTGSGCIAIALAKHNGQARFIATDISPAALAVARENAKRYNVSDRIEFIESDLLGGIDATIQPHLIVSNPPYVGRTERGTLDESVRRYEPEIALYGGDNGDEVIGRLVHESASKLVPGGFLIFETSPMLAAGCLAMVEKSGQFSAFQIKRDMAKLDRAIVARKK
jgi:release factor glutamine methyltransferase